MEVVYFYMYMYMVVYIVDRVHIYISTRSIAWQLIVMKYFVQCPGIAVQSTKSWQILFMGE